MIHCVRMPVIVFGVFPERRDQLGDNHPVAGRGWRLSATSQPFGDQSIVFIPRGRTSPRPQIKIFSGQAYNSSTTGFVMRKLWDSEVGHNATSNRLPP